MSKIVKDPNGSLRVQFRTGDGRRLGIRLGIHLTDDLSAKAREAARRKAEAFREKVDLIHQDILLARPHDDDLARWIRGLDPGMLRRLERVGLVSGVGKRNTTLDELLTEWLKGMSVKESTSTTYRQAERSLLDYFKKGHLIRTIGPREAEKWRQWMLEEEGLAEATVSKRVKSARQAFKLAVKWKYIPENPFAEVKAGSQRNRARLHFVTLDVIRKVLDACPDHEWRLIVALSRYGGLRCPSEHLGLRIGDVKWDQNKFLVRSPKTEHHEGGDSRWVPLFPELVPYLRECEEQAEVGQVHMITRYRKKNCNLRTQFMRILHGAGVTPWPRLFHNLRSSRQTELSETYPSTQVCRWLGNTEQVARDHYEQDLDAHYDRAARQATPKTVSKSVRHGAAPSDPGRKPASEKGGKTPENPGDLVLCGFSEPDPVTPAGLEPATCGLEGRCSSN